MSDDGTWTALDSVVANNANAAMPRSYRYGENSIVGSLYNWYAATAESGKYDTNAYIRTSDSICPSGWHIVTAGSTGAKSYQSVLLSTYGYSVSTNTLTQEAILALGRHPFSLVYSRGIEVTTGNIGTNLYMTYWTDMSYTGKNAVYLFAGGGNLAVANNTTRTSSDTVRCVMN